MENIICQTCLSKNRQLIPLEKVKGLIRDVIDTEISNKNGGICWECHYIMLKYLKFKLQVHHAQESLRFMVQDSKCFSKLSTVSKNYYDYQFSFHSDPCSYEEEVKPVIKSELLSDSYVNKYDNSDNNDQDEWLNDQKPDITQVKVYYARPKPLFHKDATNHEDFTSNDTQIDNINSIPDLYKVRAYAGTRPFSDTNDTDHEDFTSDDTSNDYTNKNSDNCPEINRVRVYAGTRPFIDNNDTNSEDLTSKKAQNNYVNCKTDNCPPGTNKVRVYAGTKLVMDNDDTNQIDMPSNDTQNDLRDSNSVICPDLYKVRVYSGTKPLSENDTNQEDFTSKNTQNDFKDNNEVRVYAGMRTIDNDDMNSEDYRNIQIDEEELKKKFTVVTYTEEEMQNHRESKRKRTNFKMTPYKCVSCVLGFTKQETFYIHMERNHNQDCPYICAVCLTRYPGKRPLERHIGTHYARYRCNLCAFETRQLWRAAHHCRERHAADDVGRVHCPHCYTLTRSKEDLAEHIKTQHTMNCDRCGRKFHKTQTLRQHMTRVHCAEREKPVYCAACDVHYANIAAYRDHLAKSANHTKRSFLCTECGSKFSSKAYLIKHYNFLHLKKSQFKCETCNELLMSADSLQAHMAARHGYTRPRDHGCPECGKKFFTKSLLKNHRRIHSEARPYTCKHCGDTFKQRPALYTHTRLRHKDAKTSKS